MKQSIRLIYVLSLITIAAFSVSAENSITLATNSWTAAFVEMAGGSVEYLAPAEMVHPPEYELKPSDVRKVRDAELLVYAGYEVLMKTVFDSFDKTENQMLQITTSYSPIILEESVLAIAERLGTVETAEHNIASYKQEISSSRQKLKDTGLLGAPVIVHFHQKPLAEALGFEILAVFGPQPFEVRQIAEMGKMQPLLIIDNAHNPMAAPLVEILGIDAVELINFPSFMSDNGDKCPDTLLGVLKYNTEQLFLIQQ